MTQLSRASPDHTTRTPAGVGFLLGEMARSTSFGCGTAGLAIVPISTPGTSAPVASPRDTDWVQSSGQGTLHAFAIVHRGPVPAFRDRAPYVVAMVELEGGARMPTNIVEVEPDPSVIKIGMALQVVFDDLNDTISLPKFRPA